jgi:hypothetical protein
MTSNEKMKVCEACEFYKEVTKQCRLCGCFMPLKTLLPGMQCPDSPPRWQ